MTTFLIVLGGQILLADDSLIDDNSKVFVKFDKGKTELGILTDGVKYFINHDWPLEKIPDELIGLSFTRRGGKNDSGVRIDAPANSVVYLLIDSDVGANAVPKLNADLTKDGWVRINPDAEYIVKDKDKHPFISVYQIRFDEHRSIKINSPGWSGFVVATKYIRLPATDSEPQKEPAKTDETVTDPSDSTNNEKPIAGATTRPALMQSSIKSLEVYIQTSGMMLGKTSEVTLTLYPAQLSHPTKVTFATQIGKQMKVAQEEAIRFIRLSYPNWYITKAELSFEDKYVNHDGGSIGAAIGTLVLSTIEGIKIAPDIAITGDISANGKVRAIGGIFAKLRGAIADKCRLVAIPEENEAQLVDAVVYNGSSIITDIQVLGVTNLSDAVAVTRNDRDISLQQAIELYSTIQKTLSDKPTMLQNKDVRDTLDQIVKLAPNHMSARLLISIAQGKQPKTLSPTASLYYTSVSVNPMIDFLKIDATATPQKIPASTFQQSQADLTKLSKIADEKIRPLIKAWSRYIDALSSFQNNRGSAENLNKQATLLKGEMSKVQADADMMQKMLKEGV